MARRIDRCIHIGTRDGDAPVSRDNWLLEAAAEKLERARFQLFREHVSVLQELDRFRDHAQVAAIA